MSYIWKLLDSNGNLVKYNDEWLSGRTSSDSGQESINVPPNDTDEEVNYKLVIYDEDNQSCSGESKVTVPACESSECGCGSINNCWSQEENTVQFDYKVERVKHCRINPDGCKSITAVTSDSWIHFMWCSDYPSGEEWARHCLDDRVGENPDGYKYMAVWPTPNYDGTIERAGYIDFYVDGSDIPCNDKRLYIVQSPPIEECICENLKESVSTTTHLIGVGPEKAAIIDVNPNHCKARYSYEPSELVIGWSDYGDRGEVRDESELCTDSECLGGEYLWVWAREDVSETKNYESIQISLYGKTDSCFNLKFKQNPSSNCNCGNVNISNISGVQGISAIGSSSHPVVTFNANTDYCLNTDFSIVHTGDDTIVTNPQPIITTDYYAFIATVPANESIYGKEESMKLILNNDLSCENSYFFTVTQNGCSCNISSLYTSTNPYSNSGSLSTIAIGTYNNNTCGDLTLESSADWVKSPTVYTQGKQFLAVIDPNDGDSRNCIVRLTNRIGEQVGEIEVYQHSCDIEDLTCTAGENSPIGTGAGEYLVGTFRKSVDCHVNVGGTPSEYNPSGQEWVNSIRCENYHTTGGYNYFNIYANVKAATISSGVRSCKITFRDQYSITNLNNGYNFEIYQGNI